MATRPAVPRRADAPAPAARRRRPDVPPRRRGPALARYSAPRRARPRWSCAARPADGEVHAEAWGPGAAWALESVPGLLGADDDPSGFEPRHPVLVEALAPPRRGPDRAQRPGHGVAGPGDPGAEGHRAGGVRGLPDAGAPVRRACARPRAARPPAVGPAHARPAAHDPVVGVAADARRPGPLADPGPGGPGRRLPGAHRGAAARGGGPPDAEPARDRGVDQRRGAAARPRGPRRGLLRRLPRGQGHRLGADRDPVRRRRSSRSSSSRGVRTGAGSRRWSAWPGCTGRGVGPGWRPAPTCPPRSPAGSEPVRQSARGCRARRTAGTVAA